MYFEFMNSHNIWNSLVGVLMITTQFHSIPTVSSQLRNNQLPSSLLDYYNINTVHLFKWLGLPKWIFYSPVVSGILTISSVWLHQDEDYRKSHSMKSVSKWTYEWKNKCDQVASVRVDRVR